MQQLQLIEFQPHGLSRNSSRELVSVLFRQRRLIGISFAAVLLIGIVLILVFGINYSSEARILVNQERQDPAISADAKTALIADKDVTIADINSEIQLVTSYDLLQSVVRTCRLDKIVTPLGRVADLFRDTGDTARMARAVNKLQGKLNVSQVSSSNVILISYSSPDPQQSANVVSALVDRYLQKHLAVHRPAGAYEFFQKEADRYQQELGQANQQLASFAHAQNTASAQAERDSSVQKAGETEYTLRTTQASIQEAGKRIDSIRSQLATLQPRVVTSDRNDDSALLAQLKSTLVNLQLKRTELLTKYEPSYAVVGEVEQQIVQTQEAIAADEKNPIRTVTTDRNATVQMLNDSLAQAQAELAALHAKETETQAITEKYRKEATDYLTKDLAQQDLLRSAKVAEGNYLLYVSKREEARIADALDQRRMMNVSVAEPATTPYLPVIPLYLLFVAAFVVACVASVSAGYAVHYLDTSIHTPTDFLKSVELPLLASVPAARRRPSPFGSRKLLPA